MFQKSQTEKILVLFCFYILLFSAAPAQYKVYTWENFENGVYPETLKMYSKASPSNVRVVAYNSFTRYPHIREGIARAECGNYGLLFQTNPSELLLAIASNHILDRTRLGKEGKAIVQADFYLPSTSANMPCIGLLAAEGDPIREKVLPAFYRLGVISKDSLYFSYMNGKKSPQPIKYIPEKIKDYNLKVPGWHRFQMVFQGPDKICCYIDGNQLKFSPVQDADLNNLRMGIMVASKPNKNDYCIIDNLSIQLANENLPLPHSPWLKPQQGITASSPFTELPSSPAHKKAGLTWFATVGDAVEANQSLKRPYFVMLYSPMARVHTTLQKLIIDSAANQVLRPFVLVGMDANQLGGGSLAKHYGVFKLPCFLVLDYYGKEKTRIYYDETMNWNTISQKISSVQ